MDKPTPTPSNNNTSDKKPNWLIYSGMAFEMFAVIGIFTALGYFIDQRLHSSPLLLITLLLAGAAISFYRIYKQLT